MTISFDLSPGTSLSTAIANIQSATASLGLPATITGGWSGTAQAFEWLQQHLARVLDPAGTAVAVVAAGVATRSDADGPGFGVHRPSVPIEGGGQDFYSPRRVSAI